MKMWLDLLVYLFHECSFCGNVCNAVLDIHLTLQLIGSTQRLSTAVLVTPILVFRIIMYYLPIRNPNIFFPTTLCMCNYFLKEVSTQNGDFPAFCPAPSKINGCPAPEFLNDFGLTTLPSLEWTPTGRSDSKRPTFDKTDRLVRTRGIMVARVLLVIRSGCLAGVL
mmetsp:Transcript_40368/g.73887  ORF Transcript_40368/g.73887 Transcript_40368/m.73887 type:complete len:166 (-) Transcript_40368:11-508(-)